MPEVVWPEEASSAAEDDARLPVVNDEQPGRNKAVVVRTFDEQEDLRAVVEVLLRVHDVDATYPPRDVAVGRAPFSQWLRSEVALGRWVAVIDGLVIGHIQLASPHDYLTRGLERDPRSMPIENLVEVGRLFVDPNFQRRGTGRLLLEAAVSRARELGLRPALAVLITSPAAIHLYAAEDWRYAGGFVGLHGIENRILVAP
jgi:GNAT superfamily N-acetyltransferase